MMEDRRFNAWLRPLAGFFALVGILALSACGGGSGAPNNPFAPIPIIVPLTVLPTAPTIYAKVPSALSISGGTAPYRAFSSNTVVLPVAQSVSGNTLPLLASPVTLSTTVTITIQDSAGASAQVSVMVLPELVTPPPALVVLPASLDAYSGIATQLTISGGVAPFRAFSSNAAVLPVTLAVTGNVVPLLAATVGADTVVMVTVQDAVGQTQVVNVTVHANPVAPPPALIVLPSRMDVFSGIATQLSVSGGVAPYRAFSSNPGVISVVQAVTGNVIPIIAASVDADTSVDITIQDAVGQIVAVPVTVHPKLVTPPPALSLLPASLDVFSGVASQLTIVGGVAPYRAFSSNTAVLPVTQAVSGSTVTLLAAPVAADTRVNITIQDAVGQTVVAVVTIHPQTVSPPPALVVLPSTVDVFPGIATALTISGGVAPYRAFSSNTAVLPVPTNVSGTVVTLLATAVAADTRVVVTIQDAVGQTAVVNVTVHPTPATPPPSPVVVLPTDVVISKGVPVVLTISGGLAPYKAYSSNPIALPVAQSVVGSSITLVAGGVSADTPVVVTVQDSAGQTVRVNVLIKADPATPPPPLAILPASSVVFSGSPAALTVSGGTPPYTAFSSNPAVLPVTQAVTGNVIPLFAANVSADTPVTITVLDSDNKTATATVLVRPSTLLNTLTVTPNRADCGATAVCTGQTAIAAVTVTAPGGGGIPNRQVRFDVIAGDYAIQNGAALVSSQTVSSDAVGSAKVVLMAFVNAPTQVALIRATDLTTGNQVTANFIIAQFTNGSAILSVLPATVTVTGADDTHCSSGIPVSYYVFGGTPPYRVVASLPTLVVLTGSPVTTNGGSFTATTNGSCFAQETFIVTDATGRTVTATLTSVFGPGPSGGGGNANCAGFSPPNPNCPTVNPSTLSLTACPAAPGGPPAPGSTATATVTGGTTAYTFGVFAGTGVSTASSSGSTLVVSRQPGTATPTATVRVTSGGLFVDVPVSVSPTTCP